MLDLVSRTEYREIIDRQLRFYGFDDSPFHVKILELQRELLDSMPTVDAIPIEWLRKIIMNDANDEASSDAAYRIIDLWQKEQEEYNEHTNAAEDQS